MARKRFRTFLSSAGLLSLFFCIHIVSGCGGGTLAGSSTPAPPSTNPNPPAAAAPPAITSVSPASVPAGTAAFTIQISGSGFVSGSVASWNGTSLTTTYVSATVLNATIPAALAAAGGTFAIAVANPDGQSSGSSKSSVAVDNPVPTITSLSPASTTAGASAMNVVVAGTGFVTNSVASFGAQPRATTVQSSTQLTMAVTTADLAAARSVNIIVTNPAPGGGVSAATVFTVYPPPPMITGIAPASLLVQSPDTPVTLTGTGFTPDATVRIAGDVLLPTSVTATAIHVTIPALELGSAIPLDLVVQEANGQSNAFTLPVLNPVPAIQSISNPVVTAGGPGFSVTLQATGIISSTQVSLNGNPLAVSLSTNFLQVPIPASDLAQVGTITLALTNPGPGGGTSNTVTIRVIAASNYLRTVNLPANALLWNPQQNLIYAAIPANATTNASSVVTIDPGSGNVVASLQMPGEPSLLAISGDNQYLYVGMTSIATIARFKLPGLTPDIQWTVGPLPSGNYPQTIYDMHVAPGLPHTLAVSQEAAGFTGATELAIYDDGVMRPHTANALIAPSGVMNVLQWGADASTIYGAEGVQSGSAEFIYSIDAQGATLTNTNMGALGPYYDSGSFVYDPTEDRIYDMHGAVDAPSTGALVGSFPIHANAFTVDPTQRRVYFLGGTAYYDDVNGVYAGSGTQISVYDQDRFTSEETIVLPAATGQSANGGGGSPIYGAAYLIRWGAAGLAFNLGSQIYILDGPLVTPGAVASSTTGNYAEPVPQLSGLSPESIAAGSPDVTITLTGRNFTPATTVSWRYNSLATTYVSDTEVHAVIPAADLSAPTAGPLLLQNAPGEGLSNLLAFTVLPNLGPDVQLTLMNLSGSDLAWNAANQRLYVAVLNNDSIRPQTIATVDPAAGTVLSTLPISANPSVLALSADDQYLYTGFANDASVQRYALPSLTPDLLIPLGVGDSSQTVDGGDARGSASSCDFAVSMGVAPALNSTLAVTQGNSGIDTEGCGATAVFDGATPRPVITPNYGESGHDFSQLTWGADATALYAQGDDGISFQPISRLTVSGTGVVFQQSVSTDIYLGFRPHFDAVTGFIYSDGGAITQPSTLAQVGNFQASGLMVPDSTLGLAYFLGQTPSQVGGNYGQGTENFTLQIFDLKTYALLDSIVVPNVIGYPIQMVRWGAAGIAFTTENGDATGDNAPGLTYLLSGPEISRVNAAAQRTSPDVERVQFTWKSRRQKRKSGSSRVR